MIILYTIKKCPYCNKLKNLLDNAEIEYNEINGDLPENDKYFEDLIKITNSQNVPTIIVGKNILVPEIAFNTIDEAFKMIKEMMD
jgi:glutaredoxin